MCIRDRPLPVCSPNYGSASKCGPRPTPLEYYLSCSRYDTSWRRQPWQTQPVSEPSVRTESTRSRLALRTQHMTHTAHNARTKSNVKTATNTILWRQNNVVYLQLATPTEMWGDQKILSACVDRYLNPWRHLRVGKAAVCTFRKRISIPG